MSGNCSIVAPLLQPFSRLWPSFPHGRIHLETSAVLWAESEPMSIRRLAGPRRRLVFRRQPVPDRIRPTGVRSPVRPRNPDGPFPLPFRPGNRRCQPARLPTAPGPQGNTPLGPGVDFGPESRHPPKTASLKEGFAAGKMGMVFLDAEGRAGWDSRKALPARTA